METETKIPTEVYSRVTGYIRPLSAWNMGKQQEYKDRSFMKIMNQNEEKERCGRIK